MARTLPRLVALMPFALAAAAPHARAEGDHSYLSIALTQTEDRSQADSVKGKDLVTIINVTGAYVQSPGLTLGLKYFNYNQNGRTTESTGTVISGYGPLVGFYHQSGIYANASYLLFPTKVYDGDKGKAEYSGGNGYVIDLGKAFEFSGWGAGLQVSYSKVTYKKYKARGQATDDLEGQWNDESIYPYLSAFVFF
jgi:hypothetical protein